MEWEQAARTAVCFRERSPREPKLSYGHINIHPSPPHASSPEHTSEELAMHQNPTFCERTSCWDSPGLQFRPSKTAASFITNVSPFCSSVGTQNKDANYSCPCLYPRLYLPVTLPQLSHPALQEKRPTSGACEFSEVLFSLVYAMRNKTSLFMPQKDS